VAPIYFTVGWSVHDAETHPEWCVHDRDGNIVTTNIDPGAAPGDARSGYSWVFMCPSGGYKDLILAQTEELCRSYDVDGFWYDITDGPFCFCEECRKGMESEGVNLDDEVQVRAYNGRKWKRFSAACNELIRSFHPQATVFYNGSTVLYHPDPRRATPSPL